MRFKRRRGYLISVLVAALAVVTLGYLALAAFASSKEDKVEIGVARSAALYAAESGILEAETKLATVGPQAPEVGSMVSGEFPRSQARYKVDVLAEGREQKVFQLLSRGTAESEGGHAHTVEYLVRYRYTQKTGWQAEWRLRHD